MPYRYRDHGAEPNQMPKVVHSGQYLQYFLFSADGDRVRKMTFSIRLRQNESEKEIPTTEMYSPDSELCLRNNRHMVE